MRPASPVARSHRPPRSPITNARRSPWPSRMYTAAAQLPADGHDTELTPAVPPAFRRPATSMAWPQEPPDATAPAVGTAVGTAAPALHAAAAPASAAAPVTATTAAK